MDLTIIVQVLSSGAIIAFILRLENRLTKVETKIDIYLPTKKEI